MIKFDKKKDKIAIIAPSSLPHGEVSQVFNSAIALLENNGFQCVYHPEIFSRKSLDFFAAKKQIRIEGLKQALEDPDVKIIWAFRGGYGATEIISDCCGLESIGKKLLIGFSDITALHALFNNKFGFPSLHASVLTSLLGGQSSSFKEIISLFENGKVELQLELLNESAVSLDKPIQAEITGGNLAVFCNLIGTKLHPDTKNKILILEDIDERGYEIHRYFMHLINSGLMDNLAAVILGDFTKGDSLTQSALDDICYRYLSSIPIYKLKGFGHGDVNRPVVFGDCVEIMDDKLSFVSPLVYK